MPRRVRVNDLERGDRLDGLIAAIRAREGVSMAELAEELRVSVRTIRRDVALLRARGIDIEGDRGRGGGIRFARFAPLPPLQLEAQQAVGLWLSVQIARRVAGLPFSRGSAVAMNKVLASLPAERRIQLRQLCRRIIVGMGASERVRETFGEITPTLLDAFERCFREGVCMSFRYTDRLGVTTHRRIEPHGIFVRTPFWYVLAVDIGREEDDATGEGANRMFRMDRIANPRSLTRSFEPCADVIEDLMGDVPYSTLGSDDLHS
jgi:predicted DNA-binding transcriptional regulator YafY